MKTDSRVLNSRSAVSALRDFLRQVAARPHLFAENVELISALKSQAGITALEVEFEDDEGIKQTKAVSLNTLKTYANELFERGFEEINYLRISAKDSIDAFNKRGQKSNKRTKSGLTKRVDEMERDLEQHQKINFILLQGLSHAIAELKIVRDTPSEKLRKKRVQDALTTLTMIASMNPPPFDYFPPSEHYRKVTQIDKYRK